MLKLRVLVLSLTILTFALPVTAAVQTEAIPVKLLSPDGKLEITVALDNEAAPVYSISYAGKLVIAPSRLGLELGDGGWLSTGLRVSAVRRATRDEKYTLVVGKTREARDHANELVVSLEEQKSPARKLELIFRAYDDGAAFRYRLPASGAVAIASERSEFRFPTDYTCWAAEFGSFTTSQEREFDRITTNRLSPASIVGLPLVGQTRDRSVTFAIAEADLDDYAGMYLSGLGYGVFSRLSPRPDEPKIAVRTTAKAGAVLSPWRVVMVATAPAKLIESTLIQSLNPPNAIGDASWVKPGRSAWDWWSGPLASGVKQVGMNDETMKHYVDFASEMGLEYMLVDAGWYTKGPSYGDGMDPAADLTKTIPEIDLPGLVKYAADRKVGIWVWAHWTLADKQMDKAFPWFESLGIKGVKIDFMDRDDQWMVDFYHRVLKKAAEHHLMIDLHGAYKPTGLARTYPNYVTQEGVMGAEYNKWSARVTATHNVTLAFTRLLVGPMDYTPGAFRNATPETFEIHGNGPQVMTTRPHQLAMYVVYESPFACVSDAPEAYRGQAGADFLKVVPTSWDETRAVAGEIGEYVVVARRRGREWYVGAMSNETAREVRVPLDFLGAGSYRATIHADGAKPTDVTTSAETVTKGGALTLELASSGGAAVRIVPAQ
jgi:alpha-glucosidase